MKTRREKNLIWGALAVAGVAAYLASRVGTVSGDRPTPREPRPRSASSPEPGPSLPPDVQVVPYDPRRLYHSQLGRLCPDEQAWLRAFGLPPLTSEEMIFNVSALYSVPDQAVVLIRAWYDEIHSEVISETFVEIAGGEAAPAMKSFERSSKDVALASMRALSDMYEDSPRDDMLLVAGRAAIPVNQSVVDILAESATRMTQSGASVLCPTEDGWRECLRTDGP